MLCKECKSPISDSALRCPVCGTKQKTQDQEGDKRKEEDIYQQIGKEVHDYKIAIIILSIVCVVAALGMCFYIMKMA